MKSSIRYHDRPAHSAPKASGRTNYLLFFLYLWLLLVNIPNFQSVFPPFGELYVREIMTVLIIGLVIWRVINRGIRSPALFVLFCLIALDTITIALMSESIELGVRLKLVVRLLILLSSIVVIPNLVNHPENVRKIFLFTMFMNAAVALTGPLQDVIGVIPQLYPYPNWQIVNSRGFLMRYVSLLGDPNVGGMVGGLLPVTILALPKQRQMFWVFFIIVWSVLLVVYSQSLTAMLFLIISLLAIWLFRTSVSGVYTVLVMLVVMVLAAVSWVSPNLVDGAWAQVTGVIRLYTSDNFSYPFERPGVLPATNRMMADLDYRLFAYLDRNDSAMKVLFGSTYDVVTPGAEYNPNGILTHNSYKEMYLAGGILQVGLYLMLFGMTFIKGAFLVTRKGFYGGLRGTVIGSYLLFSILLFGLSAFPVYHYSGVGQLLSMSISIVNIAYDRSFTNVHRSNT